MGMLMKKFVKRCYKNGYGADEIAGTEKEDRERLERYASIFKLMAFKNDDADDIEKMDDDTLLDYIEHLISIVQAAKDDGRLLVGTVGNVN